MRRSHVMTGFALVATIALVGTAVAGPSLGPNAGSAAKKGKRGPAGPAGKQGPQGPQGPAGAAGAPGSALAFGVITHPGAGAATVTRSKNITSAVDSTSPGFTCINVAVPFTFAMASPVGGGSATVSKVILDAEDVASLCPAGNDIAVVNRFASTDSPQGGASFAVLFN